MERPGSSNSSIHFGRFAVDLRAGELRKEGRRIRLQEQPLQILALLLERRGKAVSREELRTKLWPTDTFVDFDHGVNSAIARLRGALHDSAERPKYIETVGRRGYRFIGTIEEQVDVLPPTLGTVADSRPQSVESVVRKKFLPIFLGVGLFAVGAWLYSSWRADVTPTPLRVVPVTSLPDRAECPAFSPDGTHVAFARHTDSPGLSGIYIQQIGSEDLLQVTRATMDWCPVWSPDGSSLAFSRYGDQEHSVYLASTLGGGERKLYSGMPAGPPLDWSPDGKSIAFSVARPAYNSFNISLLTVETLETHELSEPPAGYQDWGPAFSPDGKQLAFVRANGTLNKGEVFLMPAAGGSARRLTVDNAHITSPPSWTRDGKSILFSSTRSGLPTVWRMSAAGGTPVQITQVGVKAFGPRVAPTGHRLAFEQDMGSSSLWSLELNDGGKKKLRRQVTASKGRNSDAQISPDGTKVVFVSDRTGSGEIYICNENGSNLLQLTNFGSPQTPERPRSPERPRWSRDGQKIVFDATIGEYGAIFVMQANGGLPRPLSNQASDNLNPSWSRDGDWIYFTSNRSGQWQIWKMPSEGGQAIQVTTGGGFAAVESADGESIYYAKTSSDPDIWRMRLEDRQEAAVAPRLHTQQWTGWTLTDKGIFFVREGPIQGPTLRFLDFATAHVKDVASLEKQSWPLSISASADGAFVVYQQADLEISNIMLLENFR
jgi:Tol biopolymer transport system component/DNA-binding winged helix-turn-helix (wHTH) protein